MGDCPAVKPELACLLHRAKHLLPLPVAPYHDLTAQPVAQHEQPPEIRAREDPCPRSRIHGHRGWVRCHLPRPSPSAVSPGKGILGARPNTYLMVLDDRKEIARLDPGGMLDLVRRLGTMTAEGWEAASDLALTPVSPRAVIVSGMGGSGIGGDLLRALLAPTAATPVVVVKDYRLPAFVGRDTLVFACSYSGNTEETLAAYQEAHAAGATVVAVTSGGALAGFAVADGHPVVRVPPGLPPRAALPHILMPVLRVTSRLGVGGVTEAEVREAAALLGELVVRWGPEAPSGENPAKALAVALEGAVPVVYASSSQFEPVAHRWKTQINENSKIFACWNAFPELNHNETVGWEGVRGGHPRLHAVLLRDRDEGARNALRVEITRELLARRAGGITEVWSQGNGLLTRLLSLVLFGDLVSVYLALLTGVDPTPVEIITEIKRRLGGR